MAEKSPRAVLAYPGCPSCWQVRPEDAVGLSIIDANAYDEIKEIERLRQEAKANLIALRRAEMAISTIWWATEDHSEIEEVCRTEMNKIGWNIQARKEA